MIDEKFSAFTFRGSRIRKSPTFDDDDGEEDDAGRLPVPEERKRQLTISRHRGRLAM